MKTYEQWKAERAPITVDEHRYRREQERTRGHETIPYSEWLANRETENIERLRRTEQSNGRHTGVEYLPFRPPEPLPIVDFDDPLGQRGARAGLTVEDVRRFKDASAEEQLEIIGRWAGFDPDANDMDPMGGYR